jgi:tetratricopeptide (TPR) repeat protein
MTKTHAILMYVVLLCIHCGYSCAAETFLVKDGKPQAQIVIDENPPRTTRLATHELQSYVEKISGATLPIVTQPRAQWPVNIYVGRSAHTDRLGITPDDLKHGAYRIVSGDDWLVLIGDDTDFTPIEPWARNNGDRVSGKLQRAWEQITGAPWGVPNGGMYKNRIKLAGDLGLPQAGTSPGKVEPLVLWGFDERGSLNAVCGFLRSLGVRWYLPGEVGEVVPSLPTIPLPRIDETVHPDFPVRRFNFRFGVHGHETAMWAMRLGIRDPNGLQIAHGMATMTDRREILEAHPDWFALYGGKRHNQIEVGNNQLCYSNEELFQETVRYARAQFDHYHFDAVSVMPPDGYVAMCQCPLCAGKDTPDRDYRGLLSDYVWDFVNRVAKEVGKTHPNRLISNCAYGTYTLPPLKIDKLEPNVLVCIVGGRRPTRNRPEQQQEVRRLREAWVAKTDNPIMVFENYPFTGRGFYLPAYVPHTMGESINATKGISQGEDIWLSVRQDFDKVAIGFNHFLVYFTARMYWGGKKQDVDAMFREYCRLFYGPAEREMHAFFTYCEANWQAMEKDRENVDTALALFAAAQRQAGTDSVYGRRVGLIDDYLKGLRAKREQLAQRRGPVPTLRLVGQADAEIVIDGTLDDAAWEQCPVAATEALRELQTGRRPIFGTSFKAAWRGGNLYFAIRCEEHPGEKLNVATTREEDQSLWYGDAVEILLETESHSYYQIAVNPAGAVVDLDRGAPRSAWFGWDSQVEVATCVADDHWTVEIRIPVIEDENDPLHQVIGRKPTQSLPWHINVCRQRIRDSGAEYSAFAPTGTDSFHKVLKFAYFYDGRSHQFEHDPSVTDYLIASRAASQLTRQRKYAEALAAFVALSEGKVTKFQQADALEQAAGCARSLRDFDGARELADRIPIEAVAKTVRMHNLLAQRKSRELIAELGREDIAAWPFWKAGDGWFARGRAFAAIGEGREADADLARALEFTSDPRVRTGIWLALGRNCEQNLKDDDAALAAYREIVEGAKSLGSADQFNGVQSLARILTRRGQFDDALAALRKVDIDKLRGHWRGSMLLALGETFLAAGRNAEALAAYRAALADDSVEPGHRKTAEAAIRAIEGGAGP